MYKFKRYITLYYEAFTVTGDGGDVGCYPISRSEQRLCLCPVSVMKGHAHYNGYKHTQEHCGLPPEDQSTAR